ncbi:MAG TPA: nitroreductase family deazaflavin-dependent oxidoreductase [Ktedonobacterales bacterium]|nr:nitroreductase family deazaflavin-dependent oxidoreductase [Ktedonobacterales bacterium]
MSMPQTPEELKAFNRQLIADFRARDPKLKGRRILLLTTTGARSGQPHTTPMTYVIDGDRVLVIASNAGAVRHPDWYRNLVANPTVTVELPDETFQARAVVAEGEEYDRLWALIVAQMPFFTDHQAKISRKIPVVILDRTVE